MKTRSERQLLQDGADWLRQERASRGWSTTRLAIKIRIMRQCQAGHRVRYPTALDISAFEDGEMRELPRWLTLAEDVFTIDKVPRELWWPWAARRDWAYAGHPVDLAEVLLHRDEFKLLETLRRLDERDRRAFSTIAHRWLRAGSNQRDREVAAGAWLRRVGIFSEVLSNEDRDLLWNYRRLSKLKKAGLASALRDEVMWPPPPPPRLDDTEQDLLDGYRDTDADGQMLLHAMATRPEILRGVSDLIREKFGPENEQSQDSSVVR